MAQLAYGAGWQTTFLVVNQDQVTEASVSLTFYSNIGTALSPPVNGGTATSTLGTTATASAAATSASASANDTAQQQVASTDDDPLKKKGKGPLLARRVSRVTVILPNG